MGHPADSGYGREYPRREETDVELVDRSVARLGRGEGAKRLAPGGLVTYKVTAEQTGGAYSLFEVTIRPGDGTPPRITHRADECFYVVEGEFEVLVNEETATAGPGSLVYVPRGNLHALTNAGETPGTILHLLTPGGPHERFFEEIAKTNAPPDAAKLAAIATGYGIEILPPPRE